MSRIVLPAAVAFSAFSAFGQNYLLVDQKEIEAAREKARRHTWAREALDGLIAGAEQAWRRPLEIPDRGGQWTHWYSCQQDGARLTTVSPAEHRCPACGRVYRGDPYDAVVITHTHSRNSNAVRDLGLAWRFTAREEFARRAREILEGYAARYRSYPRHNTRGEDRVGGGKLLAQTLDESVWLIPVAWGYSLVRDTMKPEVRARIENDLLLPAADVIREHKMGIHNIQCWKNSAVGLVGLVTGREDLVREAIEDPERGWRVQIEKGVTADGLWWEGSLGYHAYTMSALWPLAEAARRAGIDLYDERYASLYDAPLSLAFPNGDPPGFNDSGGGNVRGLAGLYELAYTRWKRPAYGRLAAGGQRTSLHALLCGAEEVPGGEMIPTESVLLKAAGFAVLRAPGLAAALRFGMHGGGHGHPDKLNLVTFGGGAVLGLDPGSINYGVPLHREWYRTTIAHNTVSVDEAPQQNADGRLESWSSRNGVTRIEASADGAYPGVRLRRQVVLSKSGIRDRFECSSETEHVYDWAFHAPGKLTSSLRFDEREGTLGAAHGYQHIRRVAAARAGGDWWVCWETGGARLTLRIKGAPGTEVFTGLGPGKDPTQMVPVVVVRRRARSTVFDARHEVSR